MAFENNDLKNNGKSKVDIIGTAEGIEHRLILILISTLFTAKMETS